MPSHGIHRDLLDTASELRAKAREIDDMRLAEYLRAQARNLDDIARRLHLRSLTLVPGRPSHGGHYGDAA